MRAGDLRQRLSFEKTQTSRTATGEELKSWVAHVEVWGGAQPVSGREQVLAGQMHALETVRFTVRYRSDLDAEMRIIWDGQPYEIISPPQNVGGRNIMLEVMATRGIRGGR